MQVVLFCAVIAFASLIQGILGFASALVAVPLALIFLPKEAVVSSMLVVGLSLNWFLSARVRYPISPSRWSSPPPSHTILAGAVMRK